MGHNKKIYNLILGLWPVYKIALWMGKQPILGSLMRPVFSAKLHQVTMIPVNEVIWRGEQTVLPYVLLEQLVEQASARFLVAECVCRKHESCQSHPTDLGCLFLGDGSAQIHPSLGRPCEVDEAIRHVQRGMQAGLYPLIAHTVIDAMTLGIAYKRMLTVCFCCECCCMVYRGMSRGPRSLLPAIQRLPGLIVSIDEGCAACGECLEKCPLKAISLSDHRAQIGADCKGCGLCVKACPYEAIKIDIEADILSRFSEQVGSYADISSNSKAGDLA
ncbi:MAG: DUF362 domain-containing protein [Acidobacteriaceae bacterium]